MYKLNALVDKFIKVLGLGMVIALYCLVFLLSVITNVCLTSTVIRVLFWWLNWCLLCMHYLVSKLSDRIMMSNYWFWVGPVYCLSTYLKPYSC